MFSLSAQYIVLVLYTIVLMLLYVLSQHTYQLKTKFYPLNKSTAVEIQLNLRWYHAIKDDTSCRQYISWISTVIYIEIVQLYDYPKICIWIGSSMCTGGHNGVNCISKYHPNVTCYIFQNTDCLNSETNLFLNSETNFQSVVR